MAHGTPWSSEDEQKLCDLWDAGARLEEIANKLNRTPGAIASRLHKPHGRIYPQDDNWWIPRKHLASFKQVAWMTEAYHERVKLPQVHPLG